MRLRFLFSLLLASLVFAAGCPRKADDDKKGDKDASDDGGEGGVPVACEGERLPKELGVEACTNNCDDDQDGFADCDDFDCKGVGGCPNKDGEDCSGAPKTEETTAELCSDGCDGDGDGYTDCNDFGCQGVGSCFAENSNVTCSDGVDNDGDGKTDCEDFDCTFGVQGSKTNPVLRVCKTENTNRQCSDDLDNDGDNKKDCADPECNAEHIVVCASGAAVDPLPAENAWQGLIDDACGDDENPDGDDYTDCADFDCQAWSTVCVKQKESGNEACSDNEDNDFDGKEDCEDTGCQEGEGLVVCDGMTAVPSADEADAAAVCSDSMNNDASATNTFTDCADFGCSLDPWVISEGECSTVENTDARCSDGVDNDNNKKVDCDDLACRNAPGVTVCETGEEKCGNGVDDDGNGFVDCDDFSCLRCKDGECQGTLACATFEP